MNVCKAVIDPRRNTTFDLQDRIRSDNVCTELVNNKMDVASLGSGIKISGEYVNFPDGDAKAAFNFMNFNCKSVAEFDDDRDLTKIDGNADNCNRCTSNFMERKRSISPRIATTAISIAMSTPSQLGSILQKDCCTKWWVLGLLFCDVGTRYVCRPNLWYCSAVSLSFWTHYESRFGQRHLVHRRSK